MKTLIKKTCLIIAVMFGCLSCSHGENNEDNDLIGDITFENYPRVDGSTSTKPLNAMVACKLLNINYEWVSNIVGEWSLQPNENDIPADYSDFFGDRIKVSQTEAANVAISESGYIPKNEAISNLAKNAVNKTSIYPNPVKDYLYFQSVAPVQKVKVYNQWGRLFFSSSNVKEKIKVSTLSAGMYILKSENIVSKFLKQ